MVLLVRKKGELGMKRKHKIEYYLDIAQAVSERGTCIRRNYGAIIVVNDEIIATGYTGSPRGRKNCNDIKYCLRKQLNVKSGSNYELCRSVHAEANCIISASRKEMIGGTIYIAGRDAETLEPLYGVEPCMMCKRLIINAGLDIVIARDGDSYTMTRVLEWVRNDDPISSP